MAEDVVKLVFCLRRREGLSQEEFSEYWRESHGPLVRSKLDALPIRRYVQCHTIHGPATDALRASREAAEPYDGVAELWFAAETFEGDALAAPEAVAAAIALLDDERTFIDLERSCLFLTHEVEVIAER
jgi:uncharacterized protein (TIGR02118 family)